MSVKLNTNPDLVELSINFSPVCSLISFSGLPVCHTISIVSPPSILRDDGTALLHGLQQRPLSDPQDGHLKVFRSCHICGYRPQCHHHGHGVLHDAWRKQFELWRSPQIISHKGAWVCPQAVQLLLHWDLHNRGWNEGWRTGTWQIHVWQVKQMSQMIDHTYSSDGTSLTSQLFSSLSLGLHWKRSKVKYSPSIRPSSEWCEFFELPEFSNSSRWPRGSAHCWTLWCRPCLRWPPSSNLSFCSLPQVGNLGLLFFLLFFIFAALGVEMFGRLGGCRWCPDGRRGRLYICYSRVRPLRWF